MLPHMPKGVYDHKSGRMCSEETKRKISKSNKGKLIGRPGTMLGKKLSKEAIEKVRLSKVGKPRPPEVREKISASMMGKNTAPVGIETRRKMSESHSGERHHNWKGGKSFEPYCQKFNNKFKERVREFFCNRCVECGKTQEENGNKLHVHHVNYDKSSCCSDVKPLFVPLCNSCHIKTNFNRQYWEERFTKLIVDSNGGKCYHDA